MPYKDPEVRRQYANNRAKAARKRLRDAALEELKSQPAVVYPIALSWAAGMFEGDGTVTISGTPQRNRDIVTLTSTDPFTIGFFTERWGGHVRTYQPKGNAKIAHRWDVAGAGAYAFLRDVLPYVRRPTVRERFEIVMASYESRKMGQRSPGYHEGRAELIKRIRLLNHRGASSANMGGIVPD